MVNPPLKRTKAKLAFIKVDISQLDCQSPLTKLTAKRNNGRTRHKKKDKYDLNNYRLVSLLSIITKVMERLVCRHSLISDKQVRFRAGHSTGNASTYTVQQLCNVIDEKQEAGLICLDISISRAFDVWHKGLMAKLKSLGTGKAAILAK